MKRKPLVFVHIGDLHITKAKEQNYLDFLSIVAQLEVECGEQLDFVFLPGIMRIMGYLHSTGWLQLRYECFLRLSMLSQEITTKSWAACRLFTMG